MLDRSLLFYFFYAYFVDIIYDSLVTSVLMID